MQNGYRRKANVEQHRIQSDYDTMPRKPKPPRNLILKKRKKTAAAAAALLCSSLSAVVRDELAGNVPTLKRDRIATRCALLALRTRDPSAPPPATFRLQPGSQPDNQGSKTMSKWELDLA